MPAGRLHRFATLSALGRAALCGMLLTGGCERREPAGTAATADPASVNEPRAAVASESLAVTPPARLEDCRFVSLSPAMTQALVDLGLGSQVVGRTPFCDSVPSEVPVVGSLLDVDYERLLGVRPTHVVVQPAAGGTDPELERLAAERHWVLIEQGLDRLEDVDRFVASLPSALAPSSAFAATPEFLALRERCDRLAADVRSLRTPPETKAPLVTLVLVGTEPLTAAGSDTFVSEMLAAAGGTNVVKATGYPELGFEDLVALNPQAILVLRETALDDAEKARVLGPLFGSATEAGRGGCIEVHVDPLAMLPSTSAPAAVLRLRETVAGLAARARPAGERTGAK